MRLGLICRPFSFHGGVETATAGLLTALRHAGHDVELISTRRQRLVPGLVVRRVPTLRHPSALRLISFAVAARATAARHGYDLVQSHERVLRQDLYRAGEGCHAGYLEAMGRKVPGVNPYHRLVLALERRIFRLRAARHVVAISRLGKEEIERRYGTDPQRVTLELGRILREDFLRQHAYSEVDAACPLDKQYWMLRAIFEYHRLCQDLLKKGRAVEEIFNLPVREELERMKEIPVLGFVDRAKELIARMNKEREREAE